MVNVKRVLLGYKIGVFLCLLGWVLNLIQLVKATAFSVFVVVKIIGVFLAPVGIVLGYYGLFK